MNVTAYKFLRKVFTLPFLPADHIPPAFEKLKEKATDEKTQEVMQYIEDTWMTSTVWTVPTWSVFNQSIRTNNDVEGWHHKLNRKACKGNLQFYLLITLMFSEAKRLATQMKMIYEGKLKRYIRKRGRTVQSQLFQLWKKYNSNQVSVHHLLKKCGAIYGRGC
jgi:hypothetical protein